jgi:hypothetical protein
MTIRGILTFLALTILALPACEKKAEPCDEPAPDTSAKEIKKTLLGKPLAGAEEVAVKDLLKDPKAYQDKLVRVSGLIEDFCHHRKAWFGVSAKEGKGMVRVFTVPRFEAPSDCKGKQATAEGKVEIIEISPEQAKHYTEGHKFLAGVTVEEGKPVLRPIIRAYGAELW